MQYACKDYMLLLEDLSIIIIINNFKGKKRKGVPYRRCPAFLAESLKSVPTPKSSSRARRILMNDITSPSPVTAFLSPALYVAEVRLFC